MFHSVNTVDLAPFNTFTRTEIAETMVQCQCQETLKICIFCVKVHCRPNFVSGLGT